MSVFTLNRPVTTATGRFIFWDVESLQNIFTVALWDPRTSSVQMFVLLDRPANGEVFSVSRREMVEKMLAANPALPRDTAVHLHDLHLWQSNVLLGQMLGVSSAESVNDPDSPSTYPDFLRPVCDTDPEYDPFDAHPTLVTYNGKYYDTVIMAVYFMEAFRTTHRLLTDRAVTGTTPPSPQEMAQAFQPTTAETMRKHNDRMFSPEYRRMMWRYLGEEHPLAQSIQRAMSASGRHVDASALNEKATMVPLKRLLGFLGRQIRESDRLSGHDTSVHNNAELIELLAYNVADVVGLEKLFHHNVYASSFDQRHRLMVEYPETVFKQDRSVTTHHAPCIDRTQVRWGRALPDTTSAQFAAKVLSPYGHLEDIPAVSFLYPHPDRARELGVESVDMLEYCRAFVQRNFAQHPEVVAQFEEVYQWYASIRGTNFNDAKTYHEDHPGAHLDVPFVDGVDQVAKRPNNLPYFDAEGRPTSAFVTFSTGGIHGAEYHQEKLAEVSAHYQEVSRRMQVAQQAFPDPLEMRKTREVPDTDPDKPMIKHTEVIASGSNISKGIARWKDLGRLAPVLFRTQTDGSTKLDNRFAKTSVCFVQHEDFSSYYPSMLMNMMAFTNPNLEVDRYQRMYDDKERLGALLKEGGLSEVERELTALSRGGVKLILNAATGSADTRRTSFNPIRMNNQIISMRLLGQLMTWLVGQTQALRGGLPVSTNTDGIYLVGDEQMVRESLDELSRLIHVGIKPEPMFLVSKDSNNRVEFVPKDPDRIVHHPDGRVTIDPDELVVVAASGGNLACHNGPDPTRSLNHSAVTDHVLVHYLRHVAGGQAADGTEMPRIDQEMDTELARDILHRVWDQRDDDPVWVAQMFQNIINASPSTFLVPFSRAYRTPIKFEGNLSTPVPGDHSCRRVEPTSITSLGWAPQELHGRGRATSMQHTNRVFMVRPNTPGAVTLEMANAAKIDKATAGRRAADPDVKAFWDKDPEAVRILREAGLTRANGEVGEDRDIKIKKISGIDPDQAHLIENGDLHEMDRAQLVALLERLDLEAYLQLAVKAYESNWRTQAHQAN